MNLFDEQPDGDPHGECAAEIRRLEARIAELEAQQQSHEAMIDLLKQQHTIDTEQLKSHSATALGGPTPVTVAAPACERKE